MIIKHQIKQHGTCNWQIKFQKIHKVQAWQCSLHANSLKRVGLYAAYLTSNCL